MWQYIKNFCMSLAWQPICRSSEHFVLIFHATNYSDSALILTVEWTGVKNGESTNCCFVWQYRFTAVWAMTVCTMEYYSLLSLLSSHAHMLSAVLSSHWPLPCRVCPVPGCGHRSPLFSKVSGLYISVVISELWLGCSTLEAFFCAYHGRLWEVELREGYQFIYSFFWSTQLHCLYLPNRTFFHLCLQKFDLDGKMQCGCADRRKNPYLSSW